MRLYEVNLPSPGTIPYWRAGKRSTCRARAGKPMHWSPGTGLNDPNIRDPLLTWNNEITFRLRVSNQQGCFGFDSINVKYYTGPEFYILNAFPPNGDGTNDFFPVHPGGDQRIFLLQDIQPAGASLCTTRWISAMAGTDPTKAGWPPSTHTCGYSEGVDLTASGFPKKER